MSSRITLFKGSSGLNTKLDPARIEYNSKSGVHELGACKNIEIDDSGRVSRKKGYTEQATGDFHSLWCDTGDVMVVKNDALCVLHPDWTTTPIRNVTPGARMAYVQVDDAIYYSNGIERGKVRTRGFFDGLSYVWNAGDYVGPETDRELSDPPTGTHLEYFAGRMWIAQGRVVWYSEQFNLSTFDLASNLIEFEDPVIMVRATVDGLFISTEKNTFFIAGTDPDGMSERLIADYPALEWSDVKFYGTITPMQGGGASINAAGGHLCAAWFTSKGACAGGPEGQFYNLTEDKIDLPSALSGAGLIWDGMYIGNMNP